MTQLVDGEEVVLLENEPEKEQVLKESTAYYMNTMLQRVISGSGVSGDGHTGYEAAVSYTHLDVYKRQPPVGRGSFWTVWTGGYIPAGTPMTSDPPIWLKNWAIVWPGPTGPI